MEVIVEVKKDNEITQGESVGRKQRKARDTFCKMAKFVEWEGKKELSRK